jgi:predicted TIM-barrel fold metal-dependent hydrolase
MHAGTTLGFAFPVDSSLAVLRLIGTGMLDREATIVVSHLGGVLPWRRERISTYGNAGPLFPNQRRLARPIGEYLDRLYVDTVAYGTAGLEYCYAELGGDRLLFGTDHPFGRPGLPAS